MLSVRYRVKADTYNTKVYLCKARAMLSKAPGFLFSSYRQTAALSPVLITMDNFYRILNDTYYAPDVQEIRVNKLFAKKILKTFFLVSTSSNCSTKTKTSTELC